MIMATTWMLRWSITFLLTMGTITRYANADSTSAESLEVLEFIHKDQAEEGSSEEQMLNLKSGEENTKDVRIAEELNKSVRSAEGQARNARSAEEDNQSVTYAEEGNINIRSAEEHARDVRSPSLGSSSFHSELQKDFPSMGRRGLPGYKLLSRKRRSGIVIRGPFYPYPRPGHPLRFTSAAPSLLPPWLGLVVTSLLMVNPVLRFLRPW